MTITTQTIANVLGSFSKNADKFLAEAQNACDTAKAAYDKALAEHVSREAYLDAQFTLEFYEKRFQFQAGFKAAIDLVREGLDKKIIAAIEERASA